LFWRWKSGPSLRRQLAGNPLDYCATLPDFVIPKREHRSLYLKLSVLHQFYLSPNLDGNYGALFIMKNALSTPDDPRLIINAARFLDLSSFLSDDDPCLAWPCPQKGRLHYSDRLSLLYFGWSLVCWLGNPVCTC